MRETKGLWLCGIVKEWMESYALDDVREDLLAQHINQFRQSAA
jgi:hypothetical protein